MTEVTTKEKKTRTPRNVDSVTKGALSLPLEERVKLKNDLQDSIEAEVKSLEDMASKAKALIN